MQNITAGISGDQAATIINGNDLEAARGILARLPIALVQDSVSNKIVTFDTVTGSVFFPAGFSVYKGINSGSTTITDKYAQITADKTLSLFPTTYDGITPQLSSFGYLAINTTTLAIVYAYWGTLVPDGWLIFGAVKRDTASGTVAGNLQIFGNFKFAVDGNPVDMAGRPYINKYILGYLSTTKNIIRSSTRTVITFKAAGFSLYLGNTVANITGSADLVIDTAAYPTDTRLFLCVDVSLLSSGAANWTTTPSVITVKTGAVPPKSLVIAVAYRDNNALCKWNFTDAALLDSVIETDELLRRNYLYPFWQSGGTGQDPILFNTSTNVMTIPIGYNIATYASQNATTVAQNVSIIGTAVDDVTPQASSISYMFYNPITKVVTNRYFALAQDPNAVLVGIIKRTSPSASVVGDITVYGHFKYNILNVPTNDGVLGRNADKDPAVLGAIFPKSVASVVKKRFNLLWGSDIHADIPTASNFITYLNSKSEISGGLLTGDFAQNDYSNSTTALMSVLAATSKPLFTNIGNHDTGNATLLSLCGTNAQVYTRFIAPFVPNMGLVGAENTGLNYYYKDFTADKIRAIVLYEYDDPNDVAVDGINYKVNRGFRTFRQTQIDWLTALLLATPSDYAVMCWIHQAPVNTYSELTFNFGSGFTSNTLNGKTGNMTQSFVTGSPMVDIFAAWKAGTNLVQSYAMNGAASYMPTVNVSVNFTSRGAGAFIGFFSGHHHQDIHATTVVGGLNYIAVTCTTADYGQSQFDDLPRTRNNRTEDAFNLISVDTVARKLYIVRIGSDTNSELKRREVLQVSY